MSKQPPPPGFVPPPPYSDKGAPTPNVIIVTSHQYGPDPQTMTCPYCHVTMTTRIETDSSMKTHLMFLLLCLFVCWPCAPFVYCADCCLVKKHHCSNCRRYLGMYDG